MLRHLDVDRERGLSADEAVRRRERWGENRLTTDAGARPMAMLAGQFTDLMIIVLIVAAVVAGMIGEALDAIANLVIVLLNGVWRALGRGMMLNNDAGTGTDGKVRGSQPL